MGKRGPSPTPKRILEARGSRKLENGARDNEFELPFSVPPMPRGMPDVAKRKWKYLVAKLCESKILNEIDGDSLERYCLELARYRRLEAAERRHLRNMDKLPASKRWEDHKLIASIHRSSDRCDKLGAKFGLSPADRTRIRVENTPEPPKAKKQRREGRLTMMPEAKQA